MAVNMSLHSEIETLRSNMKNLQLVRARLENIGYSLSGTSSPADTPSGSKVLETSGILGDLADVNGSFAYVLEQIGGELNHLEMQIGTNNNKTVGSKPPYPYKD